MKTLISRETTPSTHENTAAPIIPDDKRLGDFPFKTGGKQGRLPPPPVLSHGGGGGPPATELRWGRERGRTLQRRKQESLR